MAFKPKNNKKKKYRSHIVDVEYFKDKLPWYRKLFMKLPREFTSPWFATYKEAKAWRPRTKYEIYLFVYDIEHKK